MISPALYNMRLYRSFHGRAEQWELLEQEYDKLKGAFGRMPIVIHLGDFLQLKPTGSSLSLLEDFETLASDGREVYTEYQSAMRLFRSAPLCFELQATNRFKCEKLRKLIAFMRAPQKRIPSGIRTAWNSMSIVADDARLREERFQIGHMIANYWETVARWMTMRARRDANASNTPLYIVQAADLSTPAMPVKIAAK